MEKKKYLTDRDIDELMEDWLDRDGETYTKMSSKHRIGWESTLEEGSSYSSYYLEAPTQKDLIRRAYPLAKDTISAMDTPFKIRVKVSNTSDSKTDGKVVFVSTKMFDEVDLSVGDKLDTFLGTTVHEGCHLLYTSFDYLREALAVKVPGINVIKTLFNIIEDERIEQMCGEDKPGLVRFLEKAKYYYFDLFYLDYVVPRAKKKETTDFERILETFLYIIRYPKYLKEDDILFFGHHLKKIKDIMLPYPVTSKDALDCAFKVFEVMKEFYMEKLSEESESEEGDDGDGDGDGGDGDSGSGEGKGGKEVSPEEALKKMLEDSKGVSEALSKVVAAIHSESDREVCGGVEGLKDSDIAEAILEDGGLLGEICEGIVEEGTSKDSFFSKPLPNLDRYRESLSRVKAYVPAIAKVIKNHCREYKLIHKSMRSGVLDTTKLAEAFQGVQTVYMREGEVFTDKVAVAVLIDESGSMGGERIRSARDTAVLINEALGNIPNVELFIYGHSGDMRYSGATELYVYRERGYAPKGSVGACSARSENRDGTAIYEVAKRVRKQTSNDVLLFVLSDGAPCARSYHGDSAMDHVKKNVEKAEKLGFSVVQVCINHSYDPAKMFKHFVILEDMGRLSIDLGKVIKKATLNKAKVHTT